MSVGVPITRLEHSPAALRQAATRCGNAAQARRLLAIALVLEGVSRQDAARQTGMDRQTLRDWVHRYNEAGIAGLRACKPEGRPPRLAAVHMAELHALVVAGPDWETHKVIRWRCVDLCKEVARRFSVTVSEDTMGRWLKKLGLTRLQPRPFHPKKDAAAQAAFKNVWPALLQAISRFGTRSLRQRIRPPGCAPAKMEIRAP